MSINTRAATIAGATASGAFWIVCSAVVILGLSSSPQAVLGNLFHLVMPAMTGGSMISGASGMPGMAGGQMVMFSVTWSGFCIGLIVWSAIAGFLAAVFAATYNRITT